MGEKTTIEVLDFGIEDMPNTIEMLKQMEAECREKQGRIEVEKAGDKTVAFRCIFPEEVPVEEPVKEPEPEPSEQA